MQAFLWFLERKVWGGEDLPWPGRRLSQVSPAPSAFRRTSEPLEGPPRPPLPVLLAARAPTHWASEGPRGRGLGRHREKSSTPPDRVPVHPPQGETESRGDC